MALFGGGVLLGAWTAWGLYSGRTTESVPYDRVETVDGVELRRYPETVLVETRAQDQYTAFRRLFQYISGENEGEESVSMTAPVATRDVTSGTPITMTAPVRSRASSESGAQVRMAFYLPPDYDSSNAPVPTDPDVRLVVEPARTLAVQQFSWYAPSWRVERLERALFSTLTDRDIEARGEPMLLQYDDPMTPPFLRRNEVAVRVDVPTE